MADPIPSDNHKVLQTRKNGGRQGVPGGPSPGKMNATNAGRPAKQGKFAPALVPILETPPRENFPIFLGVGIALAILALATVFVLLIFSHPSSKKKPLSPPAAATAPVSRK